MVDRKVVRIKGGRVELPRFDIRCSEEGPWVSAALTCSRVRLALSPGVQLSSNGILGARPQAQSRMYKCGREHRGRRLPNHVERTAHVGGGIDIGSEAHHVAVVDEAQAALVKPTPFAEDVADSRTAGVIGASRRLGLARTCP